MKSGWKIIYILLAFGAIVALSGNHLGAQTTECLTIIEVNTGPWIDPGCTAGNAAETMTREVHVVDRQGPVITLFGCQVP